MPGGQPPETSLALATRWRRQAVEGAELAVVELGSPDAPAILVAHGAGSSARFVTDAFGDAVVGAGGRLVAYDARGHGASSAARDPALHHLDVLTADLARVASETVGEVAVVGGVSLGAHAAVRALTSGAVQAEAALVCLPAWTGRAEAGAGPHAMVAAEVRRVGVEGMLARLRDERDLPSWLSQVLLRDLARHDRASVEAVLSSLDGGAAPELDEIALLTVPVAVVGWSGDPGHPLDVAESWASAARQSSLERLRVAELDEGVDALGAAAVAALRSWDIAGLRFGR